MLKDELLEKCRRAYEESPHGDCPDCNNEECCRHDCDRCLGQVHWFDPAGGNCGRNDYDCFWLLLRYVERYTEKYSAQIASALQHVDLSRYPMYNIFSIGCGAAPDLMAFEELNDGKPIFYKGYDRNLLWEDIHDVIEEYTEGTWDITSKFVRKDIFDVFAEGKPKRRNYNVLVIQYLLSHLYNTRQDNLIDDLFDAIIENVLPRYVPGSPFLIIITDIDSMNKGRNTWYRLLDKLEDAGCYGHAIAKSAFPAGDLGAERWSNHKMSPVFGNISYCYIQNPDESTGAQLIIELG